MTKNVLVIGGGIVGLSCAYYLFKEGHKVTVVDKGPMAMGASYVNAGFLTPSHIIPLAAPGMMAKGLKWMFNSSSPFYLKPRPDPDFLRWAWNFNKSSTKAHVEKAIPLIREINLLSKALYTEIHDSGDLGAFQLEKKGLLMLYKTAKSGRQEKEVARRASDEGLEVRELSTSELNALQPGLSPDILGAVYYECDAHTTPDEVMPMLKNYLIKNGVAIRTEEEVTAFVVNRGRIDRLMTNKKAYSPDEIVLASGSWSQELARKLGLTLMIQAGKGYRINVRRPTCVRLPAILMEAKVAVTPMQGFTRFAGTMELSGINHRIRKERVMAIAKAAGAYYPGLSFTVQEVGEARCGLRPVTPDGLPYIGRTSRLNNLSIATGHAMMGWSLGPATGKLIAELVSEKPASMRLEGFHPERKF